MSGAVGWMLGAGLAHTAMISIVHALEGAVHPLIVLFFRDAFAALLLAPFAWRSGTSLLRRDLLPGHMLRLALNLGALAAYFWSLHLLDLSTVVAVHFTAPVFALLFARIFFAEAFSARALFAIGCGLAGVFLILGPAQPGSGLGIGLVLLAAVLWGATMVVIRRLSMSEGALATSIKFNILATPASALLMLPVWQSPGPSTIGVLGLIGAFAAAYNVFLARAVSGASISAVLPYDYVRIIWVISIGAVVFDEPIGVAAALGSALIVLGNLAVLKGARSA